MLFSAKRSNDIKILRKAKVDHFRENENDQRQLFKVVKVCFEQFFVEKIDKIRDNFGTSEGFDKYDTRDFVIPKLSQFTPVSVEEIQKLF